MKIFNTTMSLYNRKPEWYGGDIWSLLTVTTYEMHKSTKHDSSQLCCTECQNLWEPSCRKTSYFLRQFPWEGQLLFVNYRRIRSCSLCFCQKFILWYTIWLASLRWVTNFNFAIDFAFIKALTLLSIGNDESFKFLPEYKCVDILLQDNTVK